MAVHDESESKRERRGGEAREGGRDGGRKGRTDRQTEGEILRQRLFKCHMIAIIICAEQIWRHSHSEIIDADDDVTS